MTYLKFEFKGKMWSIDMWLAAQLDSINWNLKKDWDFVILITGDRSVRVGKSVLAMIVCAYLAWSMKKLKMNDDAYNIDDIYFDHKPMMEEAPKKPQYSINHYDEGREGLAAIKAMRDFQQDLMDFFAECGQLNHIFVIVCPDFFELKEEIAVGRSEFLLNVYRKEVKAEMDIYNEGSKRPITVLRRGYLEFFNKKKKAMLFDRAKTTRRKWYGHIKCNFVANFPNQYPIGEEEYKKRKADALNRFQERHKRETHSPREVMRAMRNADIVQRHKNGESFADIREKIYNTYKSILGEKKAAISERMLRRIVDGEVLERNLDQL